MTFTPMFAAFVIVFALIFGFTLRYHRETTTTAIKCEQIGPQTRAKLCSH